MTRSTHALLGALVFVVSASLQGCPTDDRRLLRGAGGTTVIIDGGESPGGEAGALGAGAGGDDSETGGVGGSSGSRGGGTGGTGDRGGTSSTGGANATGGTGETGGSSGTGGIPGCRGSSCSCFEDGGDECADEPCCSTLNLPAGAFRLGGAGASSVGAELDVYRLDKFEVTVGRFRKFVENYLGPPQPEAGQHPWVVASGWQSPWDTSIAADAEALAAELGCDPTQATWTDEPGTNEARPMNCVSWFEAFAFCAWDGGRLPTEAEWEYAASGGDAAREFPWGSATPTHDLALYACDGQPLEDCTASDLAPVGSKPTGAGRFSHADLAGSIAEWVLDWHAPYVDPCDNCANVDSGSERVTRGGSFLSPRDVDLRVIERAPENPAERFSAVGFRCARDD